MSHLLRALTALFGCHHEDMLQFTADRLWVECLRCGRVTPGISLGQKKS
jgi:hypothetical protein